MGVGDVPTWVAAVAAWAGVVVNAAIVFVALSPIRTAKRERTARGRLVASHLYTPMAYSAPPRIHGGALRGGNGTNERLRQGVPEAARYPRSKPP